MPATANVYVPATITDVERALTYISPDCDRQTWISIANAIKNEFDESGYFAFDTWSANSKSYASTKVLSVWKSVSSDGCVIPINYVFKLARANGYKSERKEFTAEEKKQFALLRAEQKKQAEIAKKLRVELNENWHRICADASLQVRERLTDCGQSPYLIKKGVGAYNVLFPIQSFILALDKNNLSYWFVEDNRQFSEFFNSRADNVKCMYFKKSSLVVPVADELGNLKNLQLISADSKKLFLPGKKKGCMHWLHRPDGGENYTGKIIVSEGYATGASGYMATGWPSVIAFDCYNLLNVTPIVRRLYPNAQIIVVGDDDSNTKGNPGATKAKKAAEMVGGFFVLPQFKQQA